MNTSFRFALTLLSTALLLPNIIGCQSSTPRATSYQMNYQTLDQSQFQALPDVDADLFYRELKPYGNWINHKTYGRVWYPSGVPKNWRPYSNGHWARTQEYGWLWVANEPWGWAPFHYGRWARDDWYGWIWIPGHTWAPAWVFWRSGGGYSAWAPMPPNAVWRPNVGLNTQHFDYNRDIYHDAWTGSCNRHLANHDMSNHRPDISMPNIIRRTNIVQNNVAIVNNAVVNPGPVINVIDAPIVPITVTTTIPVNITTTSASTATAVVVQPQIQGPTLEQIAKEEHLAKALAEQNTAAAKEPADKQLREPSRLTGAPIPKDIATPINGNEPASVVNGLVPNDPLPHAQSPIAPPTKRVPVDATIPHRKPSRLTPEGIATPINGNEPAPVVNSLVPNAPLPHVQSPITPPTNRVPVDPTISATPTPPETNLVPLPQNPVGSAIVSPTNQVYQGQAVDIGNPATTVPLTNPTPLPQLQPLPVTEPVPQKPVDFNIPTSTQPVTNVAPPTQQEQIHPPATTLTSPVPQGQAVNVGNPVTTSTLPVTNFSAPTPQNPIPAPVTTPNEQAAAQQAAQQAQQQAQQQAEQAAAQQAAQQAQQAAQQAEQAAAQQAAQQAQQQAEQAAAQQAQQQATQQAAQQAQQQAEQAAAQQAAQQAQQQAEQAAAQQAAQATQKAADAAAKKKADCLAEGRTDCDNP